MQRPLITKTPLVEIVPWFAPLGLSARLFVQSLTPAAFTTLSWAEMRLYCRWMGLRSFHLVALAACAIGVALTIQCVIELSKYRAQDLSGAVISIGLLREVGPLTVSIAWCVRVASLLAEEARQVSPSMSELNFARRFVLPRYLCALAMSIPLGGYGLLVGFVTGALAAPLLGVNSTMDFLESARQGIQDRDLVTYFVKLIVVNPTVGVFAGCAAGFVGRGTNMPVASQAVTATFIGCYIANLIFTMFIFSEQL